jgi:hypothetical protein
LHILKPEIAIGDRNLAIENRNIAIGDRNIPVADRKYRRFSVQRRGHG